MKIILYISILACLTSCGTKSKVCIDYKIDWNDIREDYEIRFFLPNYYDTTNLDNRSCTDFISKSKSWTTLYSNEMEMLKAIIEDTSCWNQRKYDDTLHQDLYGGFVFYDPKKCIIGKMDLIDGGNSYEFFPNNPKANRGGLSWQGFQKMDDLYDRLEKRIKPNEKQQTFLIQNENHFSIINLYRNLKTKLI